MAKLEHGQSSAATSVFETGEKIRRWMDTGLDNYERLEVFHSLLSSMTNMEVRYFHGILHSFMGRDWQSMAEAQDLIRRTNDLFSLRQLYARMEPQLLTVDEMIRNQLILDLSVLHPGSTACADVICDFIERSGISPMTAGQIADEQTMSDLLMIVSMSFRHPAFRFHQRIRLGQIAVELVSHRMAFTRFQQVLWVFVPFFSLGSFVTATEWDGFCFFFTRMEFVDDPAGHCDTGRGDIHGALFFGVLWNVHKVIRKSRKNFSRIF